VAEEKNDIKDSLDPGERADDQSPDLEKFAVVNPSKKEIGVSSKKVELDIEELPEELAAEGEAERDVDDRPPEGEKEELEKEPKLKTSRIKLLLVGSIGGLALILVVVGLILVLSPGKQNEEQHRFVHPVKQQLLINMEPFIVNFPSSGQDMILKLTMALTFTNLDAKKEFSDQQVVMRDLIYRFLQGQGSADLNKRTALVSLQKDIAKLINSALTRGRVNMVLFQEFLIV